MVITSLDLPIQLSTVVCTARSQLQWRDRVGFTPTSLLRIQKENSPSLLCIKLSNDSISYLTPFSSESHSLSGEDNYINTKKITLTNKKLLP